MAEVKKVLSEFTDDLEPSAAAEAASSGDAVKEPGATIWCCCAGLEDDVTDDCPKVTSS